MSLPDLAQSITNREYPTMAQPYGQPAFFPDGKRKLSEDDELQLIGSDNEGQAEDDTDSVKDKKKAKRFRSVDIHSYQEAFTNPTV